MRHHARTLLQVVVSYLLLASVGPAAPQKAGIAKTEEVRLGYELILTKCRGSFCHSDSVAKGEVHLSLEEEDASFAWGYDAVEVHGGNLAYQLRFKASRASKEKGVERALDIGFSGRTGTLSGKQLTWAQKTSTDKRWETSPTMSVSGKAYSEGDETITPTLHVTVLKVVK